MAVQLTEKAADAVKRLHTETNQDSETFLRLGLKPGGCGGLEYKIEFDKEFDEEKDTKYECHGVDVVVDKKSSLHLDGTTVEWYESLEKQGFTFENPNAVRSCGCGSSFHT